MRSFGSASLESENLSSKLHAQFRARPYNRNVNLGEVVRRLAAAAGALALAFGTVIGTANADPQSVAVSNPPIIRIQMRAGILAIRSWDRSSVQIDSSDQISVSHFNPNVVARNVGTQISVPSGTIAGKNGPVTLPVESFPLLSIPDGPHDGVVIKGDVAKSTTVTIPQNTALLIVQTGRGRIDLTGYRGGTFFIHTRAAAVFLKDDGGNGYVQVMRGPIVAADSSFSQFRARTALGNMLFERCHVKQIQASSIEGSIVYDNGSFEPGLAHFESQNGDVALGLAAGSNAQFGAHSQDGRIFSNFDRQASVSGSPTDKSVILGGGGPIVTASSQTGSVYLYDGALRQHRNLSADWQPARRWLDRSPGRSPAPRRHPPRL